MAQGLKKAGKGKARSRKRGRDGKIKGRVKGKTVGATTKPGRRIRKRKKFSRALKTREAATKMLHAKLESMIAAKALRAGSKMRIKQLASIGEKVNKDAEKDLAKKEAKRLMRRNPGKTPGIGAGNR